MNVYLLYSTYPCDKWTETDPHGPSLECDCEEFFDGVFQSPEIIKKYIPQYLNGDHFDLEWKEVNSEDFPNPYKTWISSELMEGSESERLMYKIDECSVMELSDFDHQEKKTAQRPELRLVM